MEDEPFPAILSGYSDDAGISIERPFLHIFLCENLLYYPVTIAYDESINTGQPQVDSSTASIEPLMQDILCHANNTRAE
jgi:hypothetical protein